MDNNNDIVDHHTETHDFMNVESFSQLPFIRPSPLNPEKPPIRLFGIEFLGGETSNESATPNNNNSSSNNNNINSCEDKESNTDSSNNNNNNNSGGCESGRRFECHYCCRNFPTSQALGGHQNAHKRERQHAKRATLHSAIVSDTHHVYGHLINYQRLSPTTSYPSWNHTNNHNRSFYGGASFSQPPINGSPLSLWRIPTVQPPSNPSFNRDRSSASVLHHHQLPVFGAGADHDLKPPPRVLAGGGGGSGSQASRYVYESKTGLQDNVSLDLHL